MAKINNIDDFNVLTSNITSFSHAYLFDTNSLEKAFQCTKEFAKSIICGSNYDKDNWENKDICYKIDHNEFDDLYIVNPDTIGIKTEEIDYLLSYMETKSLKENGKRVYIVYGFERLTPNVSNKILKFLEAPSENIYALLITENIDAILSTIISRCQVINITFDKESVELESINNIKNFLLLLFSKKYHYIAYVNDLFNDLLENRIMFYNYFSLIEKILSENLTMKYNNNINDAYYLECLYNAPFSLLIKVLDITNRLKSLIKQNINLNLLLDRYIIEVAKELMACKEL